MAANIVEPPTIEEVRAAREVLRGVSMHTPLVPVRRPGRATDLWFKPEIHQPAGSFKIRGVFHAVARMTDEQRAAGISTVSAGNTAKALAWADDHTRVRKRVGRRRRGNYLGGCDGGASQHRQANDQRGLTYRQQPDEDDIWSFRTLINQIPN